MRLYTRPNSPYWYAEFTVNGATRRLSTGVPNSARLRGQALARAAEEQQRLINSHGMTLKAACIKFLEQSHGKLASKTHEQYTTKLVNVVRQRPETRLSELTPTWLRAYIAERRGQKATRQYRPNRKGERKTVEYSVTDIQIQHEITALSAMIRMAISEGWDGIPEINPCVVVPLKGILAKSERRARWLKPEQVQALLDACSRDWWRSFIMLAVETGMRCEEIAGLTWSEVDLKAGVITLPPERNKTRRHKQIPLSDTAIHTLSAIAPHTRSPYVLTNHSTGTRFNRDGLSAGFARIRNRAGLPAARIHDLRHTFASWTRQLGMEKDDRKGIMGQSSEDAHAIYSHSTLKVLRETLNRFSPSTLLAHETPSRGSKPTSEEE